MLFFLEFVLRSEKAPHTCDLRLRQRVVRHDVEQNELEHRAPVVSRLPRSFYCESTIICVHTLHIPYLIGLAYGMGLVSCGGKAHTQGQGYSSHTGVRLQLTHKVKAKAQMQEGKAHSRGQGYSSHTRVRLQLTCKGIRLQLTIDPMLTGFGGDADTLGPS